MDSDQGQQLTLLAGATGSKMGNVSPREPGPRLLLELDRRNFFFLPDVHLQLPEAKKTKEIPTESEASVVKYNQKIEKKSFLSTLLRTWIQQYLKPVDLLLNLFTCEPINSLFL